MIKAIPGIQRHQNTGQPLEGRSGFNVLVRQSGDALHGLFCSGIVISLEQLRQLLIEQAVGLNGSHAHRLQPTGSGNQPGHLR
jgi:hypothetical protein